MLGHSTMLADDSRSWRGTLPAILHNETYYSWCATTHVMSCDRSAASTGMALLGTAHAARQHDLPARISALPLLHGKSPIELVTALRKHTIAGYYLPFLCADKQMLVGVAISSNTSTHWRRHVSGVSRSRPTDHPLKWCQHCKDSDIATVGRAYWHVDWQYPTNLICAAHDMPLSIVPGSSKRWLLPHQLPAEHPSDSLSSSHTLAAKTLAAIGSTLPTIESVDMQSLRFATLDRLRDIGVIHSLTRSSHGAFHDGSYRRQCPRTSVQTQHCNNSTRVIGYRSCCGERSWIQLSDGSPCGPHWTGHHRHRLRELLSRRQMAQRDHRELSCYCLSPHQMQ